MPQRCRICVHPDLKVIEDELKGGASIHELARRYELTRFALMRHRGGHAATAAAPARPPLRVNRSRSAKRPKPAVVVEAKDQFLTEFATHGDFSGAAAIAGITRATVQTWLEHDEEFTLRFHQAKVTLIDQLEATAIDRAIHGAKRVREVWRADRLIERIIEWAPQETILVKLLQALRPEVYAEKLQVTQTQIVKTVDADAWVAV